MSLANNSGEYIAAAYKAAPPIAVTGVTAAGLSLQDWVYILTGVYLILQIAFLIINNVIRKRNGS